MSHHFYDLAFTPKVKAQQTLRGSRAAYAGLSGGPGAGERDELSDRDIAFIRARDSFYLASVSETGWPYVQHRGGAPGFIHCLDRHMIGWAEYAGNRQYVSLGNVSGDDRVAMILMDYPNRRRLKLLGRMSVFEVAERPDLSSALNTDPDGPRAEQFMLVAVEAADWNCPQHITPRFTLAEIEDHIAPLRERIRMLEAQSGEHCGPDIEGGGQP